MIEVKHVQIDEEENLTFIIQGVPHFVSRETMIEAQAAYARETLWVCTKCHTPNLGEDEECHSCGGSQLVNELGV